MRQKFARPCNGANDAKIVHVPVDGQSLAPKPTAYVKIVLIIQKHNAPILEVSNGLVNANAVDGHQQEDRVGMTHGQPTILWSDQRAA